jgi:hypothetical protein
MAKNLALTREAQTTVALPVAAGTKSGDVVLIGTSGLTGWALTDRATTATINSPVYGQAPQGLQDGEASVELIGIHTALYLTVAGAVVPGDRVYKVTADGSYSKTATGGTFIGYSLTTTPDAGVAIVGLAR